MTKNRSKNEKLLMGVIKHLPIVTLKNETSKLRLVGGLVNTSAILYSDGMFVYVKGNVLERL